MNNIKKYIKTYLYELLIHDQFHTEFTTSPNEVILVLLSVILSNNALSFFTVKCFRQSRTKIPICFRVGRFVPIVYLRTLIYCSEMRKHVHFLLLLLLQKKAQKNGQSLWTKLQMVQMYKPFQEGLFCSLPPRLPALKTNYEATSFTAVVLTPSPQTNAH